MSEKHEQKPPHPTALNGSPEGKPPQMLATLERRDTIVIGRDVTCDLVVDDTRASRRHCRLTRSPEGFVLEDLGSRNGTLVEGRPIQGPVVLKANQVFRVGGTVFFLA